MNIIYSLTTFIGLTSKAMFFQTKPWSWINFQQHASREIFSVSEDQAKPTPVLPEVMVVEAGQVKGKFYLKKDLKMLVVLLSKQTLDLG